MSNFPHTEENQCMNDSAEVQIRRQVSQAVRNLIDRKAEVPYIDSDVACCSYRLTNLVEQMENVRLTETLKEDRTIGWCRTVRNLVPVAIDGNGNGLEYAAAFSLWGSQSMAFLLRRLIFVSMFEFGEQFQSRWRRQHCCEQHTIDTQETSRMWCELIMSLIPGQTETPENELDATCSSLSTKTEYLTNPLQVFVLANVLRRPIVVLSNDPSCQGVFLPLTRNHADCTKYPLTLAFYQGRFLALVGSDSQPTVDRALEAVPLVTSQLEPLRVWFLLDDEESKASSLQQQYMLLTEVNLTDERSFNMILVARLKYHCLRFDYLPLNNQPISSLEEEEVAMHQSGAAYNPTTTPYIKTGERTYESGPEMSLIRQRCAQPTCQYFTSIHTHPFCHEHVSVGVTSAAAVNKPEDLSITGTQCNNIGCSNYASCFIYPYCYEHIDRKIVDYELQQKERSGKSHDMSLTMTACEQGGCHNHASRFIYPYCYEHIEKRFAEAERTHLLANEVPASNEETLLSVTEDKCECPGCNNRSSVWTHPVCYEHLEYFCNKNKAMRSTVIQCSEVPLPSSSAMYAQTMVELEARTKSVASRCKTVGCPNYGNSRRLGYCNDCFQRLDRCA